MKKRSRFNAGFALLALLVTAVAVYLIKANYPVNADSELFFPANPLKMGDNSFVAIKTLDISGRFIGLNGSLFTIDEAKKRGIISGIFTSSGKELKSTDLLVEGTSFIIKVQDISVSPALYLEGIK